MIILKNIFVGVFPSHFITKFITFHRMMNEKSTRYPFVIMNTDRSDKKGMHWLNFLGLHPKKKYFYSTALDLMVLKNFYYKMIKKLLMKFSTELKKLEKKDSKIMVITLTFSMEEYKNIKAVNRLSETTQDILHLINEFGKLHNLKEEVRVHFIDDQPQKTETNTCRVFQLYFFCNLIQP